MTVVLPLSIRQARFHPGCRLLLLGSFGDVEASRHIKLTQALSSLFHANYYVMLEALLTVDKGRGGLKFFAEDSDVASEASFDLAVVFKAK